MAGGFDKWDRVKKIVVVFQEMYDSEIVIVMAERQGQIRGRREIKNKNQPALVIRWMAGDK